MMDGEEEHMDGDADADNDVWGNAAEGYTPLADLHGGNPFGDAIMVSMGPSSPGDDDEIDNGRRPQSAFFVNPAAFSSSSSGNNLNEESEDEEDTEDNRDENIQYSQLLPSESDQDKGSRISAEDKKSFPLEIDPDNFQSIADKLLGALDDDYERTVRGDSGDTAQDTVHQNTAAFSAPPIFEQDDLKLFASAFDNRHDTQSTEDAAGAVDFNVNWDEADAVSSKAHSVDIQAVSKAVENIKSRNKGSDGGSSSFFQQKFTNWNQYQFHSIIPVASLKAFRRTTPKAIAATATLSRAATAAEAISRILGLDLDTKNLCIHILGVDHVECETPERIQALFRPLVLWLALWKSDLERIEIVLIGRDLNVATCSEPVSLISASATSESSRVPNSNISLQEATASCHNGVYHEWLEEHSAQIPQLMIAYNAGIWGYNEWKTTIEYLDRRPTATPLIITAYTLPECNEDYGVLEEIVPVYKCIWGPQDNPFGSKIQAPHSSNKEYRENAAWQAWNLGGEKKPSNHVEDPDEQ